jgi:hypothetical protein
VHFRWSLRRMSDWGPKTAKRSSLIKMWARDDVYAASEGKLMRAAVTGGCTERLLDLEAHVRSGR